ncbi:MAG TPA: hypothetical protein VLZ78_04360 [Terrimesophilobacter sp.]|nr:hypothetical protein [Terrimesophilobacter sp.]
MSRDTIGLVEPDFGQTAPYEEPEADGPTLRALRDEIADGLRVRAGAALDPMVILERANNLAARIAGGFYIRRRP